jgi:hypothetical protein
MTKSVLILLISVLFVYSAFAENFEFTEFYPVNSGQAVLINWSHPSEEEIKAIVGNAAHEIKWIDENNYILEWEKNNVFQTLASFNALTIPSDAVYISSASGCEVWYSPQESYNRENNLLNQSNYQYFVSSRSGSGWYGIHNQINPSDLCSYWLYNMSDSCSIKSTWETQCLNKTSSYCNSKDSWGPWQTLCPTISSLTKYNSRKYYDFSRNPYGYCYIYSTSNEDEYLGQCSSSCYYGICDGGNECTGVNCGSNAYCSSGSCYCNSGYGNCNGSFSDGCEANLNSDNYNCGYCGNYCGAGYECISGSCVLQDPCSGVSCNNYCSGETRYFNGYCSNGSCIGYNSENCNNYDGYTCNGNIKEYRDYYCSPNACNYSVSSSTDCDSLDNYGDWEYYCSGNDRRQHRKFYDYGCSSNDCSLISSNFVDDQLTETCLYECLGSPPNAYCNNGCSGQLNVTVQDKQGSLLQNAEVFVNGELKGTTDSSGKLSIPTLSSDCGEIYSIQVVSAKGTDCGTKTTIINEEADQDFIYFACYDPLPQLELDAVPGTYTYVLNEPINFSVEVFDEFSNLLSNVGIGIIDPLLETSFFNVIPSFPWIYSSEATSTGSSEFSFSAFKTGFEPDYKKVSVQIESLPSIKVQVKDLNENPIENAKVYLDENFTGTTDSLGTKRIADVPKGPHSIEVQCANNKTCGKKAVVAVSGENEIDFVCNCGVDILVKVLAPTENLPLANAYIFVDDENKGTTNATGIAYLKDISLGEHEISAYIKCKNDPNDENVQVYLANKIVNIDSDSSIINFSTEDFLVQPATQNPENEFIEPQAIPLVVAMGIGTAIIVGMISYKFFVEPTLNEAAIYNQECVTPWLERGEWSDACWDETVYLGATCAMLALEKKKIPKRYIGGIRNSGTKIISQIPKNARLIKSFGKIKVYKHGTNKLFTKKINGGWSIVSLEEVTGAFKQVKNDVIKIEGYTLKIGGRNITKTDIIEYVKASEWDGLTGKVRWRKGRTVIAEMSADASVDAVAAQMEATVFKRQSSDFIKNFTYKGRPAYLTFTKNGRNIEAKWTNTGQPITEIDGLMEKDGVYFIPEVKTGETSNILNANSIRKITKQKELQKEVFESAFNAPNEHIYIVPQDVANASEIGKLKKLGKVVDIPYTNKQLEEISEAIIGG